MDGFLVKLEVLEPLHVNNGYSKNVSDIPVIDLDSSDDDSSASGIEGCNGKRSRISGNDDEIHGGMRRKSGEDVVLPAGFLDPLPPKNIASPVVNATGVAAQTCKQFWKAGDFEEIAGSNWDTSCGGMDHVRVHPRFLHSNATSHKWVLGAFAELLDNSLDEVCNGATYVNIDMLKNKKDGNRMLLIEDNGGGMDPDKMRQCMSFGYSLKNKVSDTIGQYGNGFKTSTMRIGADVIVFSRCSGKDGKRSTQSIGLLSYTFLRSTGKEDIIVPMLDYERGGREWKKILRSSAGDWDRNAEAVVQWSPFSSEADLLKQFDHMKDQGTRIIIYNMWEDDQGQLELDFNADKNDIQIRGVNRDEKKIEMANKFPNSKHFLTYRHSLRSYASILYLRIPSGFRMILRGMDVQHHNIVNDMMMTNEVIYRPHPSAEGVSKDSNIVAIVTMGFVKDAKSHIDVQGYNVYHKNRLIKPFWRLWNAASSGGRGVIGVLEANFLEPAHDKQGFERTIVLSRLETRLIRMQKTYWGKHCHKIGYAPQTMRKRWKDRESSPDISPKAASSIPQLSLSSKSSAIKLQNLAAAVNDIGEGNNTHQRSGEGPNSRQSAPSTEDICDEDFEATTNTRHKKGSSHLGVSTKKSTPKDGSHSVWSAQHAANSGAKHDHFANGKIMQVVTCSQSRFPVVGENESAPLDCTVSEYDQLVEENRQLKEKLKRKEEEILGDLLHDLESERNRCKALETQVEKENEKCEILKKEQDSIIDLFPEERERRDKEEGILRNKLKEATVSIQELVERVKRLELEKMKTNKWNVV